MSKIDDALAELKKSGKPDALYAAVQELPRPKAISREDDEDVDPVNPEIDKIGDAHYRGDVSDKVYAKIYDMLGDGART